MQLLFTRFSWILVIIEMSTFCRALTTIVVMKRQPRRALSYQKVRSHWGGAATRTVRSSNLGTHRFLSTTNNDNGNGNSSNNVGLTCTDENRIKSYRITGSGQRSSVDMQTDTGHFLQTDIPKQMGGDDAAPQPVEMLLCALLGCTQATAIFVGRQMNPRLLIEKIEYDVSGHRDERGALQMPIDKLPEIPTRLQLVSGVVRVFAREGKNITPDELKTLEEQTEVRCPIAHMIKTSGCKLNITWEDGSREKTEQ